MFAKQLILNHAKGIFLTAILFAISGETLFGYDDADLLNEAAAAYRANLDSLTSLAGHVSVVRESNRDGKTSVSERAIRFAYNWKSGGEYFFSKTDSPVSESENESRTREVNPLFEAELFTDGLYYRLRHRVGYEGIKTVFVNAKRFSRPEFYNGAFVPEYFMSYEGGNFDELLTVYADNIDDLKLNGRLTRRGDVFVVSRFPSDSERKMEVEVDLSKSGNPIRIERESTRDGRKSSTTNLWKWQKINGVWIPSEIKRTEADLDGDSERTTTTLLKWHRLQVNEPVDDIIQIASLGVYR
ncbi:hypothetical protein SH449x_002532 [Pirellulaceae bacterium SH449]